MRVLVITWAPGGNLPPLLAAASILTRRGHAVTVLCSGETTGPAERLGLPVVRYRDVADPDVRTPFEARAAETMATLADPELALHARAALGDVRPDLAIVDCMLPAAIAAARAGRIPAASLVHFLYGPARRQMLQTGGAGTTDLTALAATHRRLGLPPPRDGLSTWEAPELVLVTAPAWVDLDAGAPAHVVHAGPLGVTVPPGRRGGPAVLLAFSTTAMAGQASLAERACAAVTGLGRPATLTLGPALARETVRVPAGIDVLEIADHDRLMSGCAAVVGHGGLGTVLRALAHGVPQLVLPLGRDQGFNARRVEELGAGLALPAGAAAAQIRSALQRLLEDGRFAAAAGRLARRIAAGDPDAAAARALERLAPRP